MCVCVHIYIYTYTHYKSGGEGLGFSKLWPMGQIWPTTGFYKSGCIGTQLPSFAYTLSMAAFTPCTRAELSSYGRDDRACKA